MRRFSLKRHMPSCRVHRHLVAHMVMSQQQRDKRAAPAVTQQQVSQHSAGGTSRVRLKNKLDDAVEAHFLYGAGERLFTTQEPTGVAGAANVIMNKNLIIRSSVDHRRLAIAGVDALTDIILRSSDAPKAPAHVITAWVALYTPPEKRTILTNILQACIDYPPNPQISACRSDIKICNIIPNSAVPQQPQQRSWIHSFFGSSSRTQKAAAPDPNCPPIGMRCEEIITFEVQDVYNNAPVEDVIMTINYDLVAVRNQSSGTDDVELRDLSFRVTAKSEDGNNSSNECAWKAKQCLKRVFLSIELDLIRAASKLEAADMLGSSSLSPQQVLTYKQRLQALLDAQEMQKRDADMHARIAPKFSCENPQKQILFKDVGFLKNNKDICTHIFVSPHQDAEELLSKFLHTVIADSCADRRNTKPEYFQKISFKVPLKVPDEQEERYKVIEHGSVHIPLSGQNIHALLSYVVTKRAAGSEHRPEIVISEAKLGVRRVPRGFKLHHCSWARYRSTDFITFAIPELTHTCVTSTLPTCWHSAKEYRTLLSPYPRKPVGVAPKHRGIALAEHHTTVPTVQPEQSAHQKPLVTTGDLAKTPRVQSDTKDGKRGTDHAARGSDTRDTFVESDKPEYRPNMAQLQWIEQMVTQASTKGADTDERSFESHIARFVEAHKQPSADSRSGKEASDYDIPQGFRGLDSVKKRGLEFGQPTEGKSASHRRGRSNVKKPLPHSEEKPQSRLLWLLSAIWKSILLILKFLIVTPLVCIYKLCTQHAAQSPTTATDTPGEASDKSDKQSATETQKENTSFFPKFLRRAKNLSAATNEADNEADAATSEPKKQDRCNKTVPTDTKSNTEENPSDQAEVPSTLQEPKIENAFFELHSALYPA